MASIALFFSLLLLFKTSSSEYFHRIKSHFLVVFFTKEKKGIKKIPQRNKTARNDILKTY